MSLSALLVLLSFAHAASGGPDAHGYSYRSGPFEYVPIATRGTKLPLADDGEYQVTLPWAFDYYGRSHTQLTVGANGAATFGVAGAIGYQNACFPRTSPSDPDLAVYWDDLDPTAGGGVYTWHDAPRGIFYVSWEGVPHADGGGGLSFQLQLRREGTISFQYADTVGGSSVRDAGRSATIGIQDRTGGTALSGGFLGVGCNAAAAPSPSALVFDYEGTGCDDRDGDGFGAPACGGNDCDDGDDEIYPGALEGCDEVDSDCDGSLVDGYLDSDGDGAPDCVDAPGPGVRDADEDGVPDTDDCAPYDASASPGAPEIPNDGVDQDCDGADLRTCHVDVDGDGAAGPSTAVSADEDCADPGEHAAATDCDDADPTVHPGAEEWCNGVDDDCDGLADDFSVDAATWYPDLDRDGHGDAAGALSSCDGLPGYVVDGTDCDDADPTVHPGAEERCDEVDQDCDGDLLAGFDPDGDGDVDCDAPVDVPVDAEAPAEPDPELGQLGGCGCASGGGPAAGALPLVLLALLRRRRA